MATVLFTLAALVAISAALVAALAYVDRASEPPPKHRLELLRDLDDDEGAAP